MKLLFSSIALSTALFMQPAQADFTGDCTKILNGAQGSFKDIFSGNPANQFFGNWCYRAYPGGVLAGITSGDMDFLAGVYVLGGLFGTTPTYVGSRNEVSALLGIQLDDIGGGQEEICDSSNNELNGITHRQEGNRFFITTNGLCIKPPKNESFCDVQAPTDDIGNLVETNIHALTTTSIFNFTLFGYDVPAIPGIPNFQDTISQSLATKVCLIHTPSEFPAVTVETDICLDITEQFAGLPGVADKVTVEFQGESTTMIVDDCFNTDADTISNLVTHQTWINQSGSFVPIN